MNSFLGVMGVAIVAVAALYFWRRDVMKRGADEAINKSQSEVLDGVAKANAARDRLRTDPEHAQRVRDRFTRT